MSKIGIPAAALLLLLSACSHAPNVDVSHVCTWSASELPDFSAVDRAFDESRFRVGNAADFDGVWVRVAAYNLSVAKPALFDSAQPTRVVLQRGEKADTGTFTEFFVGGEKMGTATYTFADDTLTAFRQSSNQGSYGPVCEFRCPVRFVGDTRKFLVLKVPDHNEYYVFSRPEC
jgi:hypothetical protein